VFAVASLNVSGGKDTVKNIIIYGTTCFIGSLPYVVTTPSQYFSSLGLGFLSTGSSVSSYDMSMPTNLGWIFGGNGYSAAMPFLLGALLASLAMLCMIMYMDRVVDDRGFVIYILYALLIINSLFPRGIYKYYLATVTPVGAVLVGNKRTAALFLVLNMVLLILPRILSPWFVLVILVLLLTKAYVNGRVSSRPSPKTKSGRPDKSRGAKPESSQPQTDTFSETMLLETIVSPNLQCSTSNWRGNISHREPPTGN
jgi:hypothetical protein